MNRLVRMCRLTSSGILKLLSATKDYDVKHLVKIAGRSESTIRRMASQLPVKQATLREVFRNLGLSLEEQDISIINRGAIMNEAAQLAWKDFAQTQIEGGIATIHSAEQGQMPTPLVYGERQKTGIPSSLLDRVGVVSMRGSWRMPAKLTELWEFIGRLHQEGELHDLITTGCSWVSCAVSDAPTFDNKSGVVWNAIAAPVGEAADYVAWGGLEQGWRTWIRSILPDGTPTIYVTDPDVQYLTRSMKLIEINGKPYRYSKDVQKVA